MARTWVAVAVTRLAAGRVAGWADGAEGTPSEYLLALRRAGLTPALVGPDLPGGPHDPGGSHDPGGPDEAGGLLGPWAGLVLCGGADVDPAVYGAERHRSVYGVDAVRDRFEIDLVRAALGAGLPVLAICRGLQVLDVALGGNLVQHLPDRGGVVAHGVPVGGGTQASHAVDVTAGSRLAEVLGGATRLDPCVSIHHQAVDRVAAGLTVTARSADGVVEALETPPGAGWCLAVQWHPERAAAVEPAQQAIFDGFAAAARTRARTQLR